MRWFVLFFVGLLAACGDDSALEATSDDRPDGTEVVGAEHEGWDSLPAPPIPARDGAVIGWTGKEIVVAGGTTFVCPPGAHCVGSAEPYLSDGAAFDPATRAWRTIAAAPMPIPPFSPNVRLGSGVYVLVSQGSGSEPTTLLRYVSTEDTWETETVPVPYPVGGLQATDDGILVYPSSDGVGDLADLVFHPADKTWTELPADPLSPSFDRSYAWAGEDLYLFAHDMTPSPGGEDGPSFVQAAVLDADGVWTRLPAGDTIGSSRIISDQGRLVDPTLGCADGGEVNNYGRCIPYGSVFDTSTQTWAALPNPPSSGEKHVVSAGAFTADEVLLAGPRGHMLDLRTDTWMSMPEIGDGPSVQRTIAGAGPYGFAFGGARFDQDPGGSLLDDAWIWTPPDTGAAG